MIDPTKITNFNQTQCELEENLLFWVFAAGHNAKSTAKGVDKLLNMTYDLIRANGEIVRIIEGSPSPFWNIGYVAQKMGWDYVAFGLLSKCGLGCWRLKSRTIKELCLNALNLRTCTIENLESIWGIGPKTSRCFLMHSRRGVRVAGLDTHILKFLREKHIPGIPKSTPTGKRYKLLEQAFLRLCDEAGKEPAEYDLEIWNYYAK